MKKTLNFAVLSGDGIGPEVMDVALNILKRTGISYGFEIEFKCSDVGGIAINSHGKALPETTLKDCRQRDAILFGSVGGPEWESLPPNEQPERAALLPLRKIFRLYANIRPGCLFPELTGLSPVKTEIIPNGLDVVCIRELTGGIYFGCPKETTELDDGDIKSVDTMVYHKSEIERIAEVARITASNRAKKVCSVDKANVLETSILWRNTVSDYFKKNAPEINLSHMYVDNAAMQLVRNPSQFDVILTENMFGDILSDELAVICGSLGMLSSASLGTTKNSLDHPFGLFEPAGGTAPDIAGKDLANPCAQILSAALMLRYSFGQERAAKAIENAVKQTIADGFRTGDIADGGHSIGTKEMGREIAERII